MIHDFPTEERVYEPEVFILKCWKEHFWDCVNKGLYLESFYIKKETH